MRALVLLGLVFVLVVVPLAVVLMARRQPIATGTVADRNHLAMARWMERQLGDDMVRVTIPEEQQRLGRSLLGEYYGESDDPKELG